MSILSGPAIIDCVAAGDIVIEPFDLECINPASIDLRLGDEVAVYSDWVDCSAENYHRTVVHGLDVANLVHFDGAGLVGHGYMSYVQDIKKPARMHTFKMDKETGWVLKPGILYLMHTLESVCTERFVPVLDGKSSIGRLGITIHLTAGFGDPGYDGQYTLEVATVHCIRVYPGMRFCQMRFHHLDGRVLSYKDTGHYHDHKAKGPVGSLAHTQFEEGS
jgi:dCTP deaminase